VPEIKRIIRTAAQARPAATGPTGGRTVIPIKVLA